MMPRVSTLLWLLANGLLLALLIWLLRTPVVPHWLPDSDAGRAVSFTAPGIEALELPIAEREPVWQQPLFSPDRQPDPTQQPVSSEPLPALTLTGIVVSGDVRRLYLHEPGKPGIRLSPGDTLEGGWTLSELDAQSATFTRQDERRVLHLPIKRLPPPSQHSLLTLPSIKTP